MDESVLPMWAFHIPPNGVPSSSTGATISPRGDIELHHTSARLTHTHTPGSLNRVQTYRGEGWRSAIPEDFHQSTCTNCGPYSTQHSSEETQNSRGMDYSIPASLKEKTLHTAHLHRWVDSSLQPVQFLHFLLRHI